MTTSQDWWPADYGHYGPLFIRMTWHAAGTYRIARRPRRRRRAARSASPRSTAGPTTPTSTRRAGCCGRSSRSTASKISWADLLVFAGNVALESMGFKTFGFGFGRPDIWEPEEIFWGPEDTWLGDERYSGDRELADPLGAVQMGLIYVNPEGPNGNPDPLAAASDIRETFARMAMNDEETVALIVGGHTFGKCHGAGRPRLRRPRARGLPRRGARASAGRTPSAPARASTRITSGLEGAWTNDPTKWDNGFLDNLFGYEWELTDEPGRRASSGRRTTPTAQDTVPDAHDPSKRHAPMMLTTDLALRMDPIYEPISKRFHENPDQLADAFAKAWYKLLHRDMGPVSRYLGPWVPEPQLWQDPVPAVDHDLIGDADIAALKAHDPRVGPVGLAAGLAPRGRRRRASAAPTSAAAPTARGSASRRRRTGRSTSRPSWPRCCRRSRRSSRTSTARSPAARRSRSPT